MGRVPEVVLASVRGSSPAGHGFYCLSLVVVVLWLKNTAAARFRYAILSFGLGEIYPPSQHGCCLWSSPSGEAGDDGDQFDRLHGFGNMHLETCGQAADAIFNSRMRRQRCRRGLAPISSL